MDRSQEGYGDAELRPAECGGEPHGCAAPDDEESLRREAEADGGEVEEGDELYEHLAGGRGPPARARCGRASSHRRCRASSTP